MRQVHENAGDEEQEKSDENGHCHKKSVLLANNKALLKR